MALRDVVAGFFPKPKPEAQGDFNDSARTTNQLIAEHERLLQQQELREAQAENADNDYRAERFKVGLQKPAPQPVPPGMTAAPPLQERQINELAVKAVAVMYLAQRQAIDAKPEKQFVAEALTRMARQIDNMREKQATRGNSEAREQGVARAQEQGKAGDNTRTTAKEAWLAQDAQARAAAADQLTAAPAASEHFAEIDECVARFEANPDERAAFEKGGEGRDAVQPEPPLPQAVYDPSAEPEVMSDDYEALEFWKAKLAAEQSAAPKPELTLEERIARRDATYQEQAVRDAAHELENDMARTPPE